MANRLDNSNYRYYCLAALERTCKAVIDAQIDAAYGAGDISPQNLKRRTGLRLGPAVQKALDETEKTRFVGE